MVSQRSWLVNGWCATGRAGEEGLIPFSSISFALEHRALRWDWGQEKTGKPKVVYNLTAKDWFFCPLHSLACHLAVSATKVQTTDIPMVWPELSQVLHPPRVKSQTTLIVHLHFQQDPSAKLNQGMQLFYALSDRKYLVTPDLIPKVELPQ